MSRVWLPWVGWAEILTAGRPSVSSAARAESSEWVALALLVSVSIRAKLDGCAAVHCWALLGSKVGDAPPPIALLPNLTFVWSIFRLG